MLSVADFRNSRHPLLAALLQLRRTNAAAPLLCTLRGAAARAATPPLLEMMTTRSRRT